MRIIRNEGGGEGAYTVLECPLNGHDWAFTRRPGRLYVSKPLPSGDTVEVPWEPSDPDQQAWFDALDLFTVAYWAHYLAYESDHGGTGTPRLRTEHVAFLRAHALAARVSDAADEIFRAAGLSPDALWAGDRRNPSLPDVVYAAARRAIEALDKAAAA